MDSNTERRKWTQGLYPDQAAICSWYPLAMEVSICPVQWYWVCQPQFRQVLCPGVVIQHEMNSVLFWRTFCFILLCFGCYLLFGLLVFIFVCVVDFCLCVCILHVYFCYLFGLLVWSFCLRKDFSVCLQVSWNLPCRPSGFDLKKLHLPRSPKCWD